MKLYYAPNACSLSPHIALREAGIPFELVKVDMRAKTAADGTPFSSISPKGYVPALVLDDGQLLTEGAVMVQWIADQKPASKLAPENGTMARVRLQEQLHFIATEVHKGMGILYNPAAPDELKEGAKSRVQGRLELLAKDLGDKAYLFGDTFTVADGYFFYTLRAWQKNAKRELTGNLAAYYARVAARPAVKAALEAEGTPA